jgi:molybdopterin-binding protein
VIRLDGLGARAGSFHLRDVSVEIARGTWAIVLGAAGAGKTTLLETVAGVRAASAGRVMLRGEDVTRLSPERRGTAIVYQRGYLFPHLTVDENLHYGARDGAYVASLAARFGADVLRDRPVRSLSGGESQVVALVRALAPRGDILLLDEPFAALDPRGRTRVRRELQALQREQGLTVLQVTHDFAEAGTLGDLALLMDGGRLVQSGTPTELFRRPATSTAAEFLGAENIYAGTVRRDVQGDAEGPDALTFSAGPLTLAAIGRVAPGPAHAVIRGEDVALSRDAQAHASARNVFAASVVEVVVSGVVARVTLDVQGVPLVATVTTAAAHALALEAGATVFASIKATAIHLC